MHECPNCHNVENTIKHYCSVCGTKINDSCPYCERPFEEIKKKKEPNKIDIYIKKIFKNFFLLLLTLSIITYTIKSIDLNNSITYLSNTIKNIDTTISKLLLFKNDNKKENIKNNQIISKKEENNKINNPILNILSIKNLTINDINLLIAIIYTNIENKSQLILELRNKINNISIINIDNKDIYVFYVFDKNINISTKDIDISELDIDPNLIGKFIYIKNNVDKTIINEKEYDLINDNLFVKWKK